MVRALLFAGLMVVAVGAILARLRAGGFSVKVAVKIVALAMGFVVSIKMVLGGYLAIQSEAAPAVIEVLGFYASVGLTLFFGVATFLLWRRGTSGSSSKT